MTELDLELDPEVAGVLREIAADPRTRLLRIDAPLALRVSPLASVEAASSGTAGWTPAEKQLLDVHREEAAAWVRRVFRRKLFADERAGSFFHHPRESVEGDRPGLRESARSGLRASERDVIGDASGCSTSASLEQLAVILARLEGGPTTDIYRATALMLVRRLADALELLRPWKSGGLVGVLEVSALSTLAMIEAQVPGGDATAATIYARICQLEPEDPRTAANAFACSLDACLESAARIAAARLDELGNCSLLTDWLGRHRTRVSLGLISHSERQRQFFSQLEPSLGPTSGAIGSALLHS